MLHNLQYPEFLSNILYFCCFPSKGPKLLCCRTPGKSQGWPRSIAVGGLTLDYLEHLRHAPLKSTVSFCGVDALVEECDDKLHILQQLRELRVRLLTGLRLGFRV